MSHLLAYIDAGTGSMLVQVLIGAIVAVPFIIKTQFARGVRIVRSIRGTKEPQQTHEPSRD
jgi:hypothetical protein